MSVRIYGRDMVRDTPDLSMVFCMLLAAEKENCN
jgi:hypothetical protein